MRSHFRHIPSVDICLRALYEAAPHLRAFPHSLLASLVNEYWRDRRLELEDVEEIEPASLSAQCHVPRMLSYIDKFATPNLRRVLNASGVIIHTNLGRSVLADTAAQAVAMAASNYCNLELNLSTNSRDSRHSLVEDLVRRITGAEAAMVVNNNAAAVLLMLDTLCAGGEVIVSRGELVEIGGSFRIPEIMARSGAILREVGATNKTHYADYSNAINGNTRAIMSVHASNFRIIGFHGTVGVDRLKSLAREHDLALIYDLGSGSLIDFSKVCNLPPEPTVSQVIAAGADLVSFSGDKALGGPQAGIIAGKKEFVEKCKSNQLARALRCDKLCLAALEATLRLYLDTSRALAEVPTARMMTTSPQELAREARSLARQIRTRLNGVELKISYRKDVSRVGGGAYPECDLPTTLVCLEPIKGTGRQLRDKLLEANPPLIGRLDKDVFCLDPRTLLKSQYREVASVVAWGALQIA